MLQASTIKFLTLLKKNNNKPWFDLHRKEYESAKADFANFIQAVIDKYGKKDKSISLLKAKECMFRINRDIRFSKDKSPYKTNMGAYISGSGKKSIYGGYYFHCEPGQSFMGGGLWMPMPSELNKVRQEIDYNFNEFKKIINSKRFKSVYKDLSRSDEYVLTRVPKGYDSANPAAEYLKLKSFVALTKLKDTDLISGSLVNKTVDAFEALYPLIEFMNESLV
ncbi:MAG: DUF2461 domain-containing protein [Bacteroidetes bacterium]|nr:DUF2461 domain-containing protein [Bacteroidota bacterium]MBS1631507.1 DUF2461 domain-containing protein [Bacteroidota bacterium]